MGLVRASRHLDDRDSCKVGVFGNYLRSTKDPRRESKATLAAVVRGPISNERELVSRQENSPDSAEKRNR